MGYFTLTCSPGRSPTWLQEAKARFQVVVKEIDTYQINLHSVTEQRELVVTFTVSIQGRHVSTSMVLSYVEADPGQQSGEGHVFEELELPA